MNKRQKVNWIKSWLQKFGDRDNETFNTEVKINGETFDISLQYNYDFDGDKYEPYDWCRRSFKHLKNNTIYDRTEEELDIIITELKSRKTIY